MSPVLDFSLDLVWLLACGTLGLVFLLIVGLLLLRWVRWRNEPRQRAFQARWRLLLMRCAVGDDVFAELPALSSRERWPFIKLWLHGQMSLKGPARERLARMAQTLGCGPWALAQLDSRYAAERLMAILALGFLKEASAAPVLLEQLHQGGNQTAVHAARALLDIDAAAHAVPVMRCLLDRRDLDFSLVAVMLKPFGASLQAAWMAASPAPGSDDVQILPWLRLARALALQLPSRVLQPFLQAPHGTDVLIAAIRLVQGESGTREVAVLADHPDWRVRTQVAQALGLIGSQHDRDVLVRLSTDPQWWVRYRAAQALMRIPGLRREEVQALISATGDKYAVDMLAAVVAEEGAHA